MAATTKGVNSAMKKIMKRVATAERAAAKRKKVSQERKLRFDSREPMDNSRHQSRAMTDEFNRAKKAVRDGWKLGPLAERQDVGEWAGARGAVHEGRFRAYMGLPLALRNQRCEWIGGAFNLNLAVGDRVVLLEGPDKGKIGPISSVLEDTAAVTVEGLNKSNMRIGVQMRGPGEPPSVNLELPIPISAVRLVHPLKDPATGVTRDVIINQLEHGRRVTDRQSGERTWSRVVPGLNVTIPWPEKPEEDHKDFPCDTLRIHSEARTFVPTLLRPPMPLQVLDELRHKYSRFRTRHDPEYLARLAAEEEEKEARKQAVKLSMRTPLQDFHRQERANKKKKGKPRLTLEMLEKIGEVIARNRERALNNASVSYAESSAGPALSSSDDDVPPPPEQPTDPSPPTPPTTSA